MENENITYKCDYCEKLFLNQHGKKVHEYYCINNPKHEDNLIGIKKSIEKNSEIRKSNNRQYRSLHPYKYELKDFTCNCLKCNKEYTITTTLELFDKGNYRKNCSRSCANGHPSTEESRKRISEGVTKYQTLLHLDIINNNDNYFYNENNELCTYKKCEDCGELFIVTLARRVGKNKFVFSGNKYCGNCWYKHSRFFAGWYKGVHCDSSWELAFLVYHLEHGSNIKRCNTYLEYTYNNSIHKYYPDFNIDGKLYEIKGYENDKAKAKRKLHPEVIILKHNDILTYIKYVLDKYGSNYCEALYEKDNNGNIIL